MKNMFKKFLIGTLAVVAFVITANLALASYDFGSAILKVGSRGQYVTTLQNLVGATPFDGVFGPKTKAKVMAWQNAHGLTADGLFGNMSKAKANGAVSGNFPAGCTNASGFSTTTGLPCSSLNANTFSAGCTNASGFSTTTGLPCSSLSAHTFPAGCTNASGFSTTTGYLCLTGLPPTTTPIVRGGGSSHHHDTALTAIAITGTTTVGQTLTAGVTPSGATVDYQWQIGTIAGGVDYPNIEGATEITYTILAGDVGKYIDVTATGTGNYSGSEKSEATAVITPADIATAGVTGFVAPVLGATPEVFGSLTAADTAKYTVTNLAWSPIANPYLGSQAYTATVTLTSTSGYKFPVAGIAVPTANGGGTVSAGTTAGGNVSGNTLSYTVLFPATAPAVITIAAVPGVTAPVTGATPVTTITETAQYTGTVVWSPTSSPFASNTVYTADITLTAKTGYTLTGVSANFFTVSGATPVTNTLNLGDVTAEFPATKTSIVGEPIVGVTAPETGAVPDTSANAGTGFTITSVVWSPVNNPFDGGTVYTATITIAPDATHTLVGIVANSFTVTGATATNAANSGVITAVFPATAGFSPVTSANYTTAGATTTITITLTSGTFKAGQLAASDFTFGGTGAEAIANALEIAAHGVFGATTGSGTIVAITGLGTYLAGSTTNTVTVLGATQATQAASVQAIAS